VEEGDLDEAKRILLEIWDQLDHPGHTAFCHCYLALVAGLRGDLESARNHLEQARDDDSESPVITGTARRLESLASGPADEPAPVVASPSV
jgi:hypothetical protein